MKDPELYWLATAIRDCNLTERWASLWTSEENELKAMTQLARLWPD
jgi:hypothetical protein